jgi:mono/diheme cytochrome c family protein
MARRIPSVAILALLALGLSAQVSYPLADTPHPKDPEPEGNGALLYRVHCQSCHGETGQGPEAGTRFMLTRPPDLTTIATRNRGRFPAEEIERIIDGRHRPPGNEDSSMPCWGLAFQQPGLDTDQQDEVDDRIRDLVSYLRSIQIPR